LQYEQVGAEPPLSAKTLIEREYPHAPLIGVGALILDHDRIVLARRGKEPSCGEWSIPGGLVHLGETLQEAVAREALEETGLQVEPQHLVELLERIFPDENGRVRYHYVLADFSCKVVGGNLKAGSDASEVAWAEGSRLEDFNLAPITLKVIRKAMEMR
jgi:8-oxo-dGTP diphosphatase